VKGPLKLTAAISGLAFSPFALASILPPNDLDKQDNPTIMANMTEAEFNGIVDEVVSAYKGIAQGHGATLTANKLWTNTTVNASANQDGNNWVINMYGGLARRPEVTPDGFAMVVCHELGHHLGGFPFYGNADWASSEGQSDYFATQVCSRKIWKDDLLVNAEFADAVTPAEKTKCDGSWRGVDDRNLCYRTVAAGKSLATLLSALNSGGVPKTETPDTRQVTTTEVQHPQAQCRLDTYLAGALCTAPFTATVIPGRNNASGQVSIAAEQDAARVSCMTATGWTFGTRPRCWYGPKLEFQALRFGYTDVKDPQGNKNGVVEPGEAVELNFALGNGTKSTTTNVRGTLTSNTAGVTVSKADATWADLAADESKLAKSPFKLNVARTMQCGASFDVELAAQSDQGRTLIKKSFLLGTLQSASIGENATKVNIPDNDRNGITSKIASKVEGNGTEAQVRVEIAHPFSADLTIDLVSPQGKTVRVFPAAGSLFAHKGHLQKAFRRSLAAGIYQTFSVKLPEGTNTKGDWALKVADKAARDVGSLEKWNLTVSKAVCAPAARSIVAK